VSAPKETTQNAAPIREAQCAYRRVGAKIHHRVPGCGTTWSKHSQGVWRGEVEVLTDEPSDSARCETCYSDASYERHPL
jgi:hypothetical protein